MTQESKYSLTNRQYLIPYAPLLTISLLSSLLISTGASQAVYAQSASGPLAGRNDLLKHGVFLHVPGPNPILQPLDGAWDSLDIETADAFKDKGKYYLYYHGTSDLREQGVVGYQIGVAVADHPLGPFRRHGDKPLIEVGPAGSWDDFHTACAMILKEGLGRYILWYSGYGRGAEHRQWSIGLATASNPLGPWVKHENNPVLPDFGYVGGVVTVDDTYYLYTEHPIGSTGDDYAPLSLATALAPAGPWTPYAGNPVMRQGQWGEWDDGGISEAEVLYHSGVFHLFYGGAKLFRPRRLTRESIGYAYSADGTHFVKYGLNPVITRESNPNLASFSEVHAVWEAPFIYLYHTIRYKSAGSVKGKHRPLGREDIGVQVLATQSPFTLDMPLLQRESLDARETVPLDDCPVINLNHVKRLALTVEGHYHREAQRPLRIHVRSSTDGMHYDTEDLFTLDHLLKPGRPVRKSFDLETAARFIKVTVENPDQHHCITHVKITATLKG